MIDRAPRWTVVLFPLALTVGLSLAWTSPVAAGDSDAPPLHQHFLRADANQDGSVQVADPIFLLAYLFDSSADPVLCLDAADVNDDEAVDVADAVSLLEYLFGAGAPPPPPFGVVGCGPDPTLAVALSCNTYGPCDDQLTDELAAHTLRRLGFGPTPERLDHVKSLGFENYLQEQLSPELNLELDNDDLFLRLAALTPESDFGSLFLWQVIMATYSRNQLREALTDFWENHFNTDLLISLTLLQSLDFGSGLLYTPEEALAEAVAWEWNENSVFRAGALGSFADLLLASATGRTMLVYLDGVFNVADAPNENYARELLELHTMGVDNGYTQTDIEEVARCFTGWTLRKKTPSDAGDPLAPILPFEDPNGVWSFHFEPTLHDYDAKTIFPGTAYTLNIPARPALSPDGVFDGFEVLGHLASLPQTAEFVSTKLVKKFVADDPPPALVAAALTTWLNTNGDLRAVVETILTSPEFVARENRWNKVETPIENLVSAVRAIEGQTSGLPILLGAELPQTGLIALGQIPFLFPTPDGQPEEGPDWMGSTDLLNRILFANYSVLSDIDPLFDPITPMVDAGIDLASTSAVAEFWLTRFFQTSYDLEERDLAVDYLATDADDIVAPLVPGTPEYEARIRSFLGYLLSTPQANKQ